MGDADGQATTSSRGWSAFFESPSFSWFPHCGSYVHPACGSQSGGKSCECPPLGFDSTELPDTGPERDLSDWPHPSVNDSLAISCHEQTNCPEFARSLAKNETSQHALSALVITSGIAHNHEPDEALVSQTHMGDLPVVDSTIDDTLALEPKVRIAEHVHQQTASKSDTSRLEAPQRRVAPSTSMAQIPAVSAEVLQAFIQNMLQGHAIQVCSTNGSCVECIISLDTCITTLFIQRAGRKGAKPRSVPLGTIEQVVVGTDIPVDVDLPLDDNCATLLLLDGQAVAFRLRDANERNLFALFLNSFAKGRREEVAVDASEELYTGWA